MDFLKMSVNIDEKKLKIFVSPDFSYKRVRDIVSKGGDIYAYFDGKFWSSDINGLYDIIDDAVYEKVNELTPRYEGFKIIPLLINRHSSGIMSMFDRYKKMLITDEPKFNTRIFYSDDNPVREDYSTFKLDYTPKKGDTPNFDKLLYTLYDKEEAEKILWFIGVLASNRMMETQKFMFLYGKSGSGKGTILKIFKMLFDGYHSPIGLDLLTSNDPFATNQIREIPLLIDEDADISKIKNDTPLLKLTAHEPVQVNMKYKAPFFIEFPGLLLTASNQPFKVRNVESGIVRRAIVVHPSDRRIPLKEYNNLMNAIKFELPYIANKAIDFVDKVGIHYYEEYLPVDVMAQTDIIYSFMNEYYEVLGEETTLIRAWPLFEGYLDDLGWDKTGMKSKFAEELKRYYNDFNKQKRIDGVKKNSVYSGLKYNLFNNKLNTNPSDDIYNPYIYEDSKLDLLLENQPAQYANSEGTPIDKWDNIKTKLKDLDTKQLHWVRPMQNHICIDFDLKDKSGEKNLEKNILAASRFPPTYGEISKSGKGIHLHYIYDGDVSKLSSLYEDGIEIKTYTGNSSLRRKFTKSNGLDVSVIASGLPLKLREDKKMINKEILKDEKHLENIIKKCLRKEVHDSTKPNVDMIIKVLNDAKDNGIKFNLEHIKSDVYKFASMSTNQSEACLKALKGISFSTQEDVDYENFSSVKKINKNKLYFFDIEVFKNTCILGYKKYKDDEVRYIINPKPKDVEELIKNPLIGFNNGAYDNYILYGILKGMSNIELYNLSQNIINNKNKINYNAVQLTYADIYDYSSDKKSLKKWQIELGLKHDEFELPWDQPLPDDKLERCLEYLKNDVVSTEKVFDATSSDYDARCILSELSGLPIMCSNNQHSAKILFGDDKRPQDKFIYTDLSKEFPGYEYSFGTSTYRGEVTGEGGYVYAEPGIYDNVGLLDIQSMHPNSLIELNYFGPYTKKFAELVLARVLIKHGRFEECSKLFDGKLAPYLKDKSKAKMLSYALKIVINSVYGMTSAKFDNKFKHPDNIDNIIAKRGALFMINLKHEVQKKGYKVAHIKTDSIKIPDIDDDIINFVMDYGKKYGYTFELEGIYDKLALVNKSTYIAKYKKDNEIKFEAVGDMYKNPYVMKRLFTNDDIVVDDYMRTKQAKKPIYLGDRFIGKSARVYSSNSGDELLRKDGDKVSNVTKTKGYKWRLDSEFINASDIDHSYYIKEELQKAYDAIEKIGNPKDILTRIPIEINTNDKEMENMKC